ncbi:MAG: anaerobic ribonucleoside-triphosphate reductase activating protein [Candidatus Diapherotrites archaeon]
MDFYGIQKTTLVDFPDTIACVLFTGRCNFKCGFCYNKDLVLNPKKLPKISEQEAIDFLIKKKKYLEGLVISGGEPTLHKELSSFIKKAKEIGYKIKLDTNGSNPEVLEKLFKEKLLDYVAMDIKSSEKNYEKACGVKIDFSNIKKSVSLIMNSGIDYEFRSTIMPEFYSKKDAELIANELIPNAKIYFLQQFFPVETLIDLSFSSKPRYSKEQALELKPILEKKN